MTSSPIHVYWFIHREKEKDVDFISKKKKMRTFYFVPRVKDLFGTNLVVRKCFGIFPWIFQIGNLESGSVHIVETISSNIIS